MSRWWECLFFLILLLLGKCLGLGLDLRWRILFIIFALVLLTEFVYDLDVRLSVLLLMLHLLVEVLLLLDELISADGDELLTVGAHAVKELRLLLRASTLSCLLFGLRLLVVLGVGLLLMLLVAILDLLLVQLLVM